MDDAGRPRLIWVGRCVQVTDYACRPYVTLLTDVCRQQNDRYNLCSTSVDLYVQANDDACSPRVSSYDH